MPSINSIDNIHSLIELAVTTVIKFRQFGGADTNITEEAKILDSVLQRLLQEASKPKSAFNRAGSLCRETLITLSDSCKVAFRDISKFFSAFETFNHVERTIASSQTFAVSQLNHGQRAALKEIADHFKSQITHYNHELSTLLITASADALGRKQAELNDTMGCDIASTLNALTVQLITAGQTHLASGGSAKNESVLWEALRPALSSRGFSVTLVDCFKVPLLEYIRALEKSSACVLII